MKILWKNIYRVQADTSGQTTVEVCLIIAGLVLALAAALHGFLPHLADGFMGMAQAIAGPVP